MMKQSLSKLINLVQQLDLEQMEQAKSIISQTPGKLIVIGNGGSNAIASHVAEDYSNNYKVTLCCSDTAVLSCFANDYGWGQAFVKWLQLFATKDQDTIILISSSGASSNIIHCAEWAKNHNFPLITLSGFKPENPLRQFGKVNFWVDSFSYKDVEISHLIILHTILESLIVPSSEIQEKNHE